MQGVKGEPGVGGQVGPFGEDGDDGAKVSTSFIVNNRPKK